MARLALLALLALAAPVSAFDPLGPEPVKALERHLVASRGEAPSLGGALDEAVRSEPARPAGSGGPASPAPEAAAGLVLWVLAAGGGGTLVGVGWRHVQRRNALDHPSRAHLLGLIRAEPGLHLRELARRTAQPPQQAAHHLRHLERLGLVASQPLAGKRRYHEAGAAASVRRSLEEAALAPGPEAQRVLAFVAAHPGASQSEVARALGMLPGAARWHLRSLAERGALEEARQGKARVYRPRLNTGPRS